MDTPPTHTWKTLQASLKPEATGERHPFFPLRDMQSGQEVRLRVLGGPFFEGLHGSYSLFEMDVSHKGNPFRLCVSGTRLARAISEVEPEQGDELAITATGDGKARTYVVKPV